MAISEKFYGAGFERATFQKQIAAPCFRKKFILEDISNASITVCGLGLYELFLNGKRITRGRLSPYISNLDHTLYYDTYDVTSLLLKGENVVGIVLGNGNLNCMGGEVWGLHDTPYTSAPKFAFDFSMENFSFDASGFVANESPIIYDDLRAGEWYDARKELGEWLLPDYDDSAWKNVVRVDMPRGEKNISSFSPVTVQGEIKAVSFRKSCIAIPAGSHPYLPIIPWEGDEAETQGWLYDFGENTTGVCRLKIKNTRPGQKVILQYGEILGDLTEKENVTRRDENCGLDLRSYYMLPQRYDHRDVYICKGAPEEIWEPYFTHHGFQYCLVIGVDDEQVDAELVTAVVLHTQLEKRADFRCSDEVVNKLWQATIRSDLGNFCHFPTDCPHREKNGWTGDAAISAEQMVMAFSCERNLAEWLYNIRCAMRKNGEIPGVVPIYNWGFGKGPAWDDVLIELPYQIWRQRGDNNIIYENASAILRYMQWLSGKRNQNGLLDFGLGDWCQSAHAGVDQPVAPTVFTSTVKAMSQCHKAAQMYRAVGMNLEAVFAETFSSELRQAGRKYLLNLRTKSANCRCQTTQAMAIYYDLFDDNEKADAVKVLVRLIENNGGSFDCGVLGMRVIFHVLSEFGYTDLAYNMITKSEYPSYGYWIANGSTTLWELFVPYHEAISSLNHHFFGDIISWFMQNLAGIKHNPNAENVNYVLIEPHFASKLSYVKASLQIPAGEVSVHWEKQDGVINICCVIPDGVTAELRLDENYQLDNGQTNSVLNTGENKNRIISAKEYNINRITDN